MIHPERIAEVMGGVAILGQEVRSFQELESTVSGGLPKVALRHTLGRVYLSAAEVRQAIYRVVPEATFKSAHPPLTDGRRAHRTPGAGDRRR